MSSLLHNAVVVLLACALCGTMICVSVYYGITKGADEAIEEQKNKEKW